MSRSLRYDNPELCDRLAAQYVAGDMTPRVRRRMTVLMAQHPALQAAVEQWSDRLLPLQQQYPPVVPPQSVWNRIEHQLVEPAPGKASATLGGHRSVFSRLWHSLSLWRAAGLGGMTAAFLLVITLGLNLLQPNSPVGADYMAPLSWNGEVALVVSGYRGSENKSAWLSAQWSDRLAERPEEELHLWAETGEDLEWVYLSKLTTDNWRWALDDDTWQAVKDSRRLVVNTNPHRMEPQLALLEGPCIRLTQW